VPITRGLRAEIAVALIPRAGGHHKGRLRFDTFVLKAARAPSPVWVAKQVYIHAC